MTDNEFESQIRRLQCNLEDNTNLLIQLNRELVHNFEWDVRMNPEVIADLIIYPNDKMVQEYGSKRTELINEAIKKVDSIRRPLADAISLLKRADKLD